MSNPFDQQDLTEEAKPKEDGNVDRNETNDEEKNGFTPSAPLPRELHRTASIFLRNLAPTITKLEIEAVSGTIKLCLISF